MSVVSIQNNAPSEAQERQFFIAEIEREAMWGLWQEEFFDVEPVVDSLVTLYFGVVGGGE